GARLAGDDGAAGGDGSGGERRRGYRSRSDRLPRVTPPRRRAGVCTHGQGRQSVRRRRSGRQDTRRALTLAWIGSSTSRLYSLTRRGGVALGWSIQYNVTRGASPKKIAAWRRLR